MGAVLWSERELCVMFHSLVWLVQLDPPYTTQEPATHAVLLPLHLTTGVITERKAALPSNIDTLVQFPA